MFLEIKGLNKSFSGRDKKTKALEEINLNIAAGEFVCVLGPSGCGKTTLFNIIAGLSKADSGLIKLEGKSVSGPGADRAVVFQQGALFPWLDVRANVGFALRGKKLGKKAKNDLINEYLKMVRLSDYATAYVHELSGGMKQRVAIARALACDSKILLLDEPFSALDNHNRELLRAELISIWDKTGKTILFITHSVEEALYLADRVVLMAMSPGRIVGIKEISTPRERNLQDEYFLALAEEFKNTLGEEIDEDDREKKIECGNNSKSDFLCESVDNLDCCI